jgi:hypothetical protein
MGEKEAGRLVRSMEELFFLYQRHLAPARKNRLARQEMTFPA